MDLNDRFLDVTKPDPSLVEHGPIYDEDVARAILAFQASRRMIIPKLRTFLLVPGGQVEITDGGSL